MSAGRPHPIFIHSMWRSCGTFIFNKFRHDDSFHCYFEPCSEFLAAASPEGVSAAIPDEVRTNLRHTGAEKQSFGAFPFTKVNGVHGFRDRFAYDRFHMPRDAEDYELQLYISILIDHAISQNRVAVAKCCRFGLRAEWLERIFNPVSIYVVREPDAMFRSYWSFGGAQSYFLVASLLIVARNRHLAVFEEVAEELQVPSLCGRPLPRAFAEARELATRLDAQDFRDVTLVLWAVTLLHNLRVTKALVDMDLLIRDNEYRRCTEERLAALVGRRISFEDVRSIELSPSPGRPISQRGAACARHALKTIGLLENCCWPLSEKTRAALGALQ
jgi:hypothetical protein